jgi:hypothetical protein
MTAVERVHLPARPLVGLAARPARLTIDVVIALLLAITVL